jgi:hypothetical protein
VNDKGGGYIAVYRRATVYDKGGGHIAVYHQSGEERTYLRVDKRPPMGIDDDEKFEHTNLVKYKWR